MNPDVVAGAIHPADLEAYTPRELRFLVAYVAGRRAALER